MELIKFIILINFIALVSLNFIISLLICSITKDKNKKSKKVIKELKRSINGNISLYLIFPGIYIGILLGCAKINIKRRLKK